MRQALCKCGHERKEHDRAYPSGKVIDCCRRDLNCFCPKYQRGNKTVQAKSQEGR